MKQQQPGLLPNSRQKYLVSIWGCFSNFHLTEALISAPIEIRSIRCYYSEIIELRQARCKDLHNKLIYQTPFEGIISDIRVNETFITSHTSGGLLNKHGNCEGTTFTNTRRTFNNVIVQAKYKIHLSEGIALVNTKENVLILPTGSRLKLSTHTDLINIRGK